MRLTLIVCLQVYETFGPTLQPFYQIRFGEKYPLDAEKVQVSRPVFHVPRRSRFVNVAELRKLKGSDASNVHDEEVAEYEMEFSDDEEEAAHKARLKQQWVLSDTLIQALMPSFH